MEKVVFKAMSITPTNNWLQRLSFGKLHSSVLLFLSVPIQEGEKHSVVIALRQSPAIKQTTTLYNA